MKIRYIPFLLAMTTASALAQMPQPPSDWAAVQRIPVGRELAIHTDDAYLRCNFVAATAELLTCNGVAYGPVLRISPAVPQSIARSDIRVVNPRRRRVGHWVAAAFATGGAILGFASDNDAGDRVLLGVVAGASLCFLGWVVGNVVDSFVDALPIDPIYQRP